MGLFGKLFGGSHEDGNQNWEEKYAWDPDCKKREAICARCRELAP